MFNPRAYKKRQAEYWDEVAHEFDEGYAAMLLAVVEQLLEAAKVRPGHRVLDLACGIGIGTFMAGRKVGATGSAVGLDIAPKMIELAQARARTCGATNVSFVTGDTERLEFPDQSFDAVVCQLGIALFPNAVGALEEARRVLEPGGHVVVTAMGRAENSSFLLLPARIAAKHLPTVVVNEGGPTQLAYAEEGALESLLTRAGFKNVWTRRFIAMISASDFETYWELFRRSVGGFAWRFARERPEDQRKVMEEIKATLSQRMSDEGIRLPLELVMGGGSRPHSAGSARSAPSAERLVRRARARVTALPPAALDDFQKDGIVIDVRQKEEYATDHLDGAKSLPRGRLEGEVQALVPDRRTPILCCCDDGFRSSLAGRTLVELGYQRVAFLEGGLTALRARASREVSG
jgi:ubiquinone/menaquinone biosynthesis C-methylase UbiE/rhodanese-related sulfurtransferase